MAADPPQQQLTCLKYQSFPASNYDADNQAKEKHYTKPIHNVSLLLHVFPDLSDIILFSDKNPASVIPHI